MLFKSNVLYTIAKLLKHTYLNDLAFYELKVMTKRKVES